MQKESDILGALPVAHVAFRVRVDIRMPGQSYEAGSLGSAEDFGPYLASLLQANLLEPFDPRELRAHLGRTPLMPH